MVWVVALGCGGSRSPADGPHDAADAPDLTPDASVEVAADSRAEGAVDLVADAIDDVPGDAIDDAAADAIDDGAAGDAGGGDGGASGLQACAVLGWGVNTLATFAPGGGTFTLANAARLEVRNWTGATKRPISNGFFGASAVAYTGDGTLLLASALDGVLVWRLSDGQLVQRIPELIGGSLLSVSDDGSVIAIGGQGNPANTVIVRSAAGLLPLAAGSRVLAVAVSPSGAQVAAAYGDRTTSTSFPYAYSARVWNVADGSIAWTVAIGNGSAPQATRMTFSRDATAIAIGSFDLSTAGRLLRVASGVQFGTLAGTSTQPVAFSGDGTGIVGYDQAQPLIWRATNGAVARTFAVPTGTVPIGVGFDAAGSVEAIVHTASPQTGGRDSFQQMIDGVVIGASIDVVAASGPGSAGMALSPDGRLVATSLSAATTLWDGSSGNLLRTWTGAGPLAFSPDSSLLARNDNGVVISTVVPGRDTLTTAAGRAAAFSPDGALLATANTDNTAQLWSAATGTLVRTLWKDALSGHTLPVRAVAFSPDGTVVATGSDDRTAKLWTTGTGDLVRTLASTLPSVSSLVFTLDGKRLFGRDLASSNQVIAWDVDTGTGTSFTPGGASNLVLSAQGEALLVGATDQILRFGVSDLMPLAPPLATPGGIVRILDRSGDGRVLATATNTDVVARRWCSP